MRILYYNWTPLHIKDGGGVQVYLRNTLDYFKNLYNKTDVEIIFLSSGYYTDKKRSDAYLIREEDYGEIECYSIVNSPMNAPHGISSASNFETSLNDTKISTIICDLLNETGPYDVIHFQSIEGLPPNVLKLKEKFPKTKFIHSIHDYGIFCRNVRFWTEKNSNCVDCGVNRPCTLCALPFEISHPGKKRDIGYLSSNPEENKNFTFGRKILNFIRNFGRKILNFIRKKNYRFRPSYLINLDKVFKKYRKVVVTYINDYIDYELAVSNRVRDIAIKYGIDPNKIKTEYIGTKFASLYQENINHFKSYKGNKSNDFRILYLGYANQQKGFDLYLKALELMDMNLSARLSLRFASKMDKHYHTRLSKIKDKFKELEIFDGYTHDDLSMITKDVDLGVVPPVWEDNLPQVTMEMISHGIPVITSDYGGAHELNSHPSFNFGKDPEDLAKAIRKISENPQLLQEYWDYSKPLTTMEEHINRLLNLYKN